jgi:kumamolisin
MTIINVNALEVPPVLRSQQVLKVQQTLTNKLIHHHTRINIPISKNDYIDPDTTKIQNSPNILNLQNTSNKQNSVGTSTYTGNHTPISFASYYKFPTIIRPNISNNSKIGIAIISYGGWYSETDINKSFANAGITRYVPNIVPILIGQTKAPIYGASGDDSENMLDLSIIATVCNSVNTTIYFYSLPNGTNTQNLANDPLVLALKNILIRNISIVSISWGVEEISFYKSQNYYNYVNANCIIPLNEKGVALSVSSGDSGSAFTDSNNNIVISTNLLSSFPTVISVGGTDISGFIDPAKEIVWQESILNSNPSASTGGQSYFVPRQYWQPNIILPPIPSNINYGIPTGISNTRLQPDIAMNSALNAYYALYVNSKLYGFGGTSCAAPLFAAFLGICKLNNPTLVLKDLNKKMYLVSTDINVPFNDILSGSNNTYTQQSYYIAKEGYDCCTGLGSFNGTVLANLLNTN